MHANKSINIQVMKSKIKRQEKIRNIISEKTISSQEELVKELHKCGINITQATLSRDMKQMKITKTTTADGMYRYMLPQNSAIRRTIAPQTISEMMSGTGFLTLKVSGNIAVVRTKPGYASSIAYHIDTANLAGVLGTIAGDDTIFLVLDETTDREDTVKKLAGILNPQ